MLIQMNRDGLLMAARWQQTRKTFRHGNLAGGPGRIRLSHVSRRRALKD
jgi:hypothetical protein